MASSITERYFFNPYLDYDLHSEKPLSSVFVAEWSSFIEDTFLQCIHATAAKSKNCNGGLYCGSLGLVYASYYLLKHGHCKKNETYIKDYVQDILRFNQAYFEKFEDITDKVEFLTGKGGLSIASCIAAKLAGDEVRLYKYAQLYAENSKICEHLNFLKNGSDEIFVGRAGYLCGLLFLKNHLNIEPLSKGDTFKILDKMIESGRVYSANTSSPSPLMYAYHRTEYIGSAHGLAGILQIIMSFPMYLTENPEAEKLVKSSVDFILSIQKSNGNFPSSMDRLYRESNKELIHWCHGAGGIIFLLAKAYLTWKDDKYKQACIKCGDLIWEKGLLKKGPGLCHGIGGHGYVHLMLYRLTNQEKYLYRACKFAEFMKTTQFKTESNIPDHPASLYEGLAGTVCFITDLLEPFGAEFPFMPIF